MPDPGRGLYALRVGCWPRQFATRRAWLRALFRTKLCLDYLEACGHCGCRQPVSWHADDALYQQVTRGFISCPRCFTRLARERGIRVVWHPAVESGSTGMEDK